MSVDVLNMDDDALHAEILREVSGSYAVLDVGGGMAAYHEAVSRHVTKLVSLDAHLPYLEKGCSRVIKWHEDARFALSSDDVWGNKYDAVLGIDFVEHLHQREAIQVIRYMQNLASNVVLLFVPEGNHPQTTDYSGLGGDSWQTHRSTWYAEDLEKLGFTVQRWVDFHRGAGGGKDPHAMWAVWRRS